MLSAGGLGGESALWPPARSPIVQVSESGGGVPAFMVMPHDLLDVFAAHLAVRRYHRIGILRIRNHRAGCNPKVGALASSR